MRNPLSHKLYLINIKLILAICYFALSYAAVNVAYASFVVYSA
jgi:hypothetical protein